MSRRSYKQAFDEILTPHGFTGDGRQWVRVRGDMWECVELQVSQFAGTTCNLLMKDLETERILHQIPSKEILFLGPIPVRIGDLIDGYDHWWRRDPSGPTELSDTVRTLGLPWFDRVRTLEEQVTNWFGGRELTRWHATTMIGRAITLYRMGKIDEARAALSLPAPRTESSVWIARVEAVRTWLESQAAV